MLGKIKKYAFKLGFGVMYLILIAEIILAISLFVNKNPGFMNLMLVIPFTWMAIMIARYSFIRVFQNNNHNFMPRNGFRRN